MVLDVTRIPLLIATREPAAVRRTPRRVRPLARVALLGNHLPRQCGIATFTTALRDAMVAARPGLECLVVAMNDHGAPHAYPPAVRCAIDDHDVEGYRRAAAFLNGAEVDAVSLQHEYGIFGGHAGGLVLPLLRALRMPVVTTLHTVLATPDRTQRRVLDEVIDRSTRVVVMSDHAAAVLQRVHGVSPEKIDTIPHGIPAVLFAGGDKATIGAEGQQVLLTFGLLSPDKGIEYVIDALPAILAAHPRVVYFIVGATHPHVLAEAGEQYRLRLHERARRLGVADHVVFINRFVSDRELGQYLGAADVYLTPYLNAEQSTSGTLAFALGAGAAMVSTPYRYATEVLADGRGVLVPSHDGPAIAAAVNALLSDPAATAAMRARAAAYGAAMRWSDVGARHLESLATAVRSARAAGTRPAGTAADGDAALPPVMLDHLLTLTDQTGVIQHARFAVPFYRDGYCLDDTARALLLVARLDDAGLIDRRLARQLTARYLAFVTYAFVPRRGRFRNFLSFARRWREATGSDDSQGRALWALGTVVARSRDGGHRALASDLFRRGINAVRDCTSPRAWAYALLGIDPYLRAVGHDPHVEAVRATLADRLQGIWQATHTEAWPWFEAHATYANARLPQAMLVTGDALGRPELVSIGLTALTWLSTVQTTASGEFSPIGSDGFFHRDAAAASFDQQPIEACGMVSACCDAARLTGDPRWMVTAQQAFRWFLGANHLQVTLLDPSTGGCRDGLHHDRVNENQGAESTLSYLLALTDLHTAPRAVTPDPTG